MGGSWVLGLGVPVAAFSQTAKPLLVLKCGAVPALAADHFKNSQEFPWLRFGVQTISDPVRITITDKYLFYERQDGEPLFGPGSARLVKQQLVSGPPQRKFWEITTWSIPEGFVDYRYDGLRHVLLETVDDFSYAPGLHPPNDSIKAGLWVTVFHCEVGRG
jgi:hypothetical protein